MESELAKTLGKCIFGGHSGRLSWKMANRLIVDCIIGRRNTSSNSCMQSSFAARLLCIKPKLWPSVIWNLKHCRAATGLRQPIRIALHKSVIRTATTSDSRQHHVEVNNRTFLSSLPILYNPPLLSTVSTRQNVVSGWPSISGTADKPTSTISNPIADPSDRAKKSTDYCHQSSSGSSRDGTAEHIPAIMDE